MKKMISLFITVVLIFTLFAGCSKGGADDGSKGNGDIQTDKHNQSGIAVDGINISWANMKLDNKSLKLTEDQKTVLRYFDNDYFYIAIPDYDSLKRYPKVFRHIQVDFLAEVFKVIEADDESYTCIAKLVTSDGMYWDYEENDESNKNYIVISGQQPDEGRVIEGDSYTFYGRYTDVNSYEIEGETYYCPTFSAYYAVSGVKYDANYIKKVAKIIFGSDVKLEDPMSSDSYMLDEYHPNGYAYYLVNLDNQSNANFSSFEFNRVFGFIRDANLKENIERQFFVSADFEHYIITVFDRNLDMVYLEYFDRDFKKLWSIELEEAESMVMDYTSKTIYVAINNDLYGIDIETGKYLFEPVFVGEKVKINLVDDGVILIGKGNKDNVMKVDLKGNLLWKTSIDLEIDSCSSLQIIDGNIVGFYYGYADDETFKEKMASVSKDGEIISEFETDTW